jgi:hypothetical protein
MRMRIVVLVLLCSGCIAGSIKAHTGVVADERGRGVQAGVSLGFGYSGKRSAVVASTGFAGGQAPTAGLSSGLDYVRFRDHGDKPRLAWRAGFGGVPLAYGEPTMSGARVASLFVVRDRESSGGHEKMWSESSRTVMAVGIEAMIGAMFYDDEREKDTTFGGAASLTFEMYALSRMW